MNSKKKKENKIQIAYRLPPELVRVIKSKAKSIKSTETYALEVIIREWMIDVCTRSETTCKESFLLSYLDERLGAIEDRLEYHQEAIDKLR